MGMEDVKNWQIWNDTHYVDQEFYGFKYFDITYVSIHTEHVRRSATFSMAC